MGVRLVCGSSTHRTPRSRHCAGGALGASATDQRSRRRSARWQRNTGARPTSIAPPHENHSAISTIAHAALSYAATSTTTAVSTVPAMRTVWVGSIRLSARQECLRGVRHHPNQASHNRATKDLIVGDIFHDRRQAGDQEAAPAADSASRPAQRRTHVLHGDPLNDNLALERPVREITLHQGDLALLGRSQEPRQCQYPGARCLASMEPWADTRCGRSLADTAVASCRQTSLKGLTETENLNDVHQKRTHTTQSQ